MIYTKVAQLFLTMMILIRVINGRSCDSEDCRNEAENSALHHWNKLNKWVSSPKSENSDFRSSSKHKLRYFL